jgi:nicotinamidase-related amidase
VISDCGQLASGIAATANSPAGSALTVRRIHNMTHTDPNLASSALIIIDVQNDFTLDDAPAQIPGTLSVLPLIRQALDAYRHANRPIVHIVRLYRADGKNVDICRRSLIESGASIVRPGTAGSQIPELLRLSGMPDLDHARLLAGQVQAIGSSEFIVYKPRWGSFYETALQDLLSSLQVDTLVFCGCNFPNCPRTSVYEASERDYRIAILQDATSRIYDQGLDELRGIGVSVLTTNELTEQLPANKPMHRAR